MVEQGLCAELVLFANPSREASYFYVPRRAEVQRFAEGGPALSLNAWGAGGYLLLTGEWRASEALLGELRAALARRAGILNPAALGLSFAPVEAPRCKVYLTSEAGKRDLLATSQTSGFPPYSALFSVHLNAEQFALAAAALRGSPGILTVTYEATLTQPVTASCKLTPCSAELAERLRPYRLAGAAEFRRALEEAIRVGVTSVVVDPVAGADADLVSSLFDRLLERATALLPRWLDQAASAGSFDFEVAVTLARDVRFPFSAELDLSEIAKPGPNNSSLAQE